MFNSTSQLDFWHPSTYEGPTIYNIETPVVHKPVYPDSYPDNYGQSHLMFQGIPPYLSIQHLEFSNQGQDLGYPANTMVIGDFTFYYEDLSGNTGLGEDFEQLNQVLEFDKVVKVGKRGMNGFFGHYFDLSNSGSFQPIVAYDLIQEGTVIVLTDGNGLSKGYEITQILNVNNNEAFNHFYGRYSLPDLIYHGNNEDMIYIQYCRWDIELGMLIMHFGYRIY